jgi:D-glycero-D-manno-heptose 1,7-bisphosphate phosphatase
MIPALFLDRDGVVIKNHADYVRSWEDVVFLPQALDDLVMAASSPYKIVIVTNQSVVGRGLISLHTAEEINSKFVRCIREAGGRIDAIYMCPHAPDDICDCRKPKPGLLLEAAEDLSIELAKSVIIGDAFSDLQAGKAAGIHKLVLVRTGRGAAQELLAPPAGLGPFAVYDSLHEALAAILGPHSHNSASI